VSKESVTIVGIPGLQRALERKVEELRASSRASVEAEIKLIEADAQESAPVDKGELRDGIESELLSGAEGTVHTTVKHSAAQEFGTLKNPAHPYMHPAAERARRRFPKTAAAIIRRALGG
jgi:HK97 gp10 family phage protein